MYAEYLHNWNWNQIQIDPQKSGLNGKTRRNAYDKTETSVSYITLIISNTFFEISLMTEGNILLSFPLVIIVSR